MNEKTENKVINPPWIEFPDYKPGCMGFRMGGGEDYMDKWKSFLNSLSKKQKEEFKLKNPAPDGWEIYYLPFEKG